MSVFEHLFYEYKMGLRNLCLYTGSLEERHEIEERLKAGGVDYYVHRVNGTKINIFFGDEICVKVVLRMRNRLLSNLSAEEDFILGIMLGYDRVKQCERYIRKTDGGSNGSGNVKIMNRINR